ncbi:hypothetical protein JCM19236_2452 [Vibrio sp. JCM 19236]|nr:hypothetical protein JCM19236_2452 [Vibrio sp. JCM 19236]
MKKFLTLLSTLLIIGAANASVSGGLGLDSDVLDDLQKQTIVVKAEEQKNKRASWNNVRNGCSDDPSCIYHELKQRYH